MLNENKLIFMAECLLHKHKSTCLRCGCSFENDYHTIPKSYCSACRLIRNKEISKKAIAKYSKTNKGKEAVKTYHQSIKGKKALHKSYEKYYQTHRGQEAYIKARKQHKVNNDILLNIRDNVNGFKDSPNKLLHTAK